ncbi:MAG TPA: carboxylating nicotinate-nucleotide diphosphorylase [Deltaproteobacteria bacterium]|nr:carboxylating nicotinate-nucleotide diphosphorylase [Deltaproteobacteria bacterium]HPR55819.1 carboxylating nicotinate-nucleotide diphosphorylase [Deltaproteobacteria bacterium]HXK47712.1 carboxylating nicotinate-nucleotide diphosphorylase [Deltaproteobacteria bacterium]
MHTRTLIDEIIRLALEEDGRDITSEAVFPADAGLRAVMKAKAAGVIAGLEVAGRVFTLTDPAISCSFEVADGDTVTPGRRIAVIDGPARGILKAERVALNFLQRMSGIATLTAEYVRLLSGTKAKILDTRKTAPGQRVLDKEAVRLGGGTNHRMGLFDMALIKDNHIDAAGSLQEAVERVRKAFPGVAVEVEARTLSDVRSLLELKVDRIMLDNFSLEEMRKAVELTAGRIPLEASGGITLETVRDVALTGVDYISAGEITHSVRALDISMIIEGDR